MSPHSPDTAATESLLAFWRDAGVDACFEDAPVDRTHVQPPPALKAVAKATAAVTPVVDASDAATGVLRVSILPSESSKLATGPDVNPEWQEGKATYYWDVEGTPTDDPEGTKTWFAGKVKVEGDVSGAF